MDHPAMVDRVRAGLSPYRSPLYSDSVLAQLVIHPRRALSAAARRPNLAAGVLAVGLTGVVSLGLELPAAVIGGGGSAAIGLSLAVPLMLAVFWLVSGLLVGAGARLMGLPPRRRQLLAVSGLTFPVLALYAVIALVQAASLHGGGEPLAAAFGLLALPLVCWFVALNAVAVHAVYELPALNAVAITLIPYAALSAVLLVLVIALSVLHSAGAV
jgi:hypothetical protein